VEQPSAATPEMTPILLQARGEGLEGPIASAGAGRSRLRRGLLAAGVLLAACACIALSFAPDAPAMPMKGSPEDGVTLDAIQTVGLAAGHAADLGTNLVQGMDETNILLKDLHQEVNHSSMPHIQGLLDSVKSAKVWLAKRGAHIKGSLGQQIELIRGHNITLPNMSGEKAWPVIPSNDLADGNPCADDEEMNGKLCYKKCSLFSDGEYPLRTTAFSCCKKEPCGFFNQKLSMKICGGFDVAGDSQGGGCPHKVGSCLGNEELRGGMCFKKCSLLTNFQLPFRMAAATCCKVNNIPACINPRLSNTSSYFNVGGGNPGNLSDFVKPHPPMTTLTEGLESPDVAAVVLDNQGPAAGPSDRADGGSADGAGTDAASLVSAESAAHGSVMSHLRAAAGKHAAGMTEELLPEDGFSNLEDKAQDDVRAAEAAASDVLEDTPADAAGGAAEDDAAAADDLDLPTTTVLLAVR